MQAKTDYLAGTHLQLDLWGDQFSSLEEQVQQSTDPATGSSQVKLSKLRRKKRTLKRRLREAAHGSTATDWESVRGELAEAVNDFRSLANEVHQDIEGA